MSAGGFLHLVLSDDPQALADCLATIREGDGLLLADAGVQWLALPNQLSSGLDELNFALVINALETDVAARGLRYATGLSKLELLSDSRWVEKVCQFGQVLSWK